MKSFHWKSIRAIFTAYTCKSSTVSLVKWCVKGGGGGLNQGGGFPIFILLLDGVS